MPLYFTNKTMFLSPLVPYPDFKICWNRTQVNKGQGLLLSIKKTFSANFWMGLFLNYGSKGLNSTIFDHTHIFDWSDNGSFPFSCPFVPCNSRTTIDSLIFLLYIIKYSFTENTVMILLFFCFPRLSFCYSTGQIRLLDGRNTKHI